MLHFLPPRAIAPRRRKQMFAKLLKATLALSLVFAAQTAGAATTEIVVRTTGNSVDFIYTPATPENYKSETMFGGPTQTVTLEKGESIAINNFTHENVTYQFNDNSAEGNVTLGYFSDNAYVEKEDCDNGIWTGGECDPYLKNGLGLGLGAWIDTRFFISIQGEGMNTTFQRAYANEAEDEYHGFVALLENDKIVIRVEGYEAKPDFLPEDNPGIDSGQDITHIGSNDFVNVKLPFYAGPVKFNIPGHVRDEDHRAYLSYEENGATKTLEQNLYGGLEFRICGPEGQNFILARVSRNFPDSMVIEKTQENVANFSRVEVWSHLGDSPQLVKTYYDPIHKLRFNGFSADFFISNGNEVEASSSFLLTQDGNCVKIRVSSPASTQGKIGMADPDDDTGGDYGFDPVPIPDPSDQGEDNGETQQENNQGSRTDGFIVSEADLIGGAGCSLNLATAGTSLLQALTALLLLGSPLLGRRLLRRK